MQHMGHDIVHNYSHDGPTKVNGTPAIKDVHEGNLNDRISVTVVRQLTSTKQALT